MPTNNRTTAQQHPTDLDFEIVPSHTPRGRTATVSIALPSSILANAQSKELRIYVAGQIARAAAIYCIDEIIIFDEAAAESPERHRPAANRPQHEKERVDHTAFFKLLLDYLETPQYLRKSLFPVSHDLRLVGLLNPLALPSHVARKDVCRWREGIAVGRSNSAKGHRSRDSERSKRASRAPLTRFIDVGLQRLVEVDANVSVGDRVTVDMQPAGPDYAACPGKYLFGRLADRDSPRILDGTYWGYKVRTVTSLSKIFSDSLVSPKGYDLTIGTSERGTPIVGEQSDAAPFALPHFSHLLVVFGGVLGLERSAQGDEQLKALGISCEEESGSAQRDNDSSHAVADLFDFYVNTCPNQGSRTIRTEEAVLISLAALQPFLRPQAS